MEDKEKISADIFMNNTTDPVHEEYADETKMTVSPDMFIKESVITEKQHAVQELIVVPKEKDVQSWPVYNGKPRGDGSVPIIELKNITHIFNEGEENEYRLFDNFNLTLPDLPGQSQIFTIMGQSGCGKSQLLKVIAGLSKFNSGEVLINGKLMTDNHHVPMIFQECANFFWNTVKENVMLPMTEVHKMSKEDASKYADQLLEIVGLTEHANKYPNKLSGGQQQRVALARSFATKSPILLCDEATSKLDPKMKRSVEIALLKMSYLADTDSTCINISHDISEAAFISNRVIILQANPCRIYRQIEIYYPGEETKERGEWVLDTPEYAEYVREISHYLNKVCK